MIKIPARIRGDAIMPQLPKKFLRVRDAVFVLPDDFDGDEREAMRLFLRHLVDTKENPVEFVDPNGVYSPLGVILTVSSDRKASYDSAIFHLIGDRYYEELPKKLESPQDDSKSNTKEGS